MTKKTPKGNKVLAGPAGAKLAIEWRDPAQLKVYEHNPKIHTPEQVEKIAAQISEFGFDQPIVVDADGMIIKGHGRRAASLALGLKKVPVIVSKLDKHKAAAARIGDNKVAEAPWDDALLKMEFQALNLAQFDMSFTGFEVPEMASIVNAWTDNSKALATIKETSDPGRAVIKVKCPFEHKDAVQKAIIGALEKTALFGLLEFE
jgi:hypothetical protein